MDHESLALHLEELIRRMREDPIFPWGMGTEELIEEVNLGAEAIGFCRPIEFAWDPERGIAQFGMRSWRSSIPSLPPITSIAGRSVAFSSWWVPELRLQSGTILLHPSGRPSRDVNSAPMSEKDRARFGELLHEWSLKIRTARRPSGPRFPEPTRGLSEKAHAVREILIEQYPRAIRGPELVRLLAERELDETEANLSARIMKELLAAGCEVRNEGKGYFLVDHRAR